MLVKRLAPLIGLAAVLTACGGSDSPETTAPDATAPDTGAGTATDPDPDPADAESPPTAADGAEGSGCTPSSETSLPDGRWFGLVASTTDSEIEFDLACWFTGDAAAAAAEEAGEESPPPNDYFVRNNNELTRDLPVAQDAEVTFYLSGDPESDVRGDLATWRGVLDERGPVFGIWIETSGGEVTSIEEMWVP